MPITKRGRQHLSTALAYYYFLRNNRMITGFHAGIRRGKVILSDGTTPLFEISARGIRPLTPDSPDEMAFGQLRASISVILSDS